MKRLYVFVFIVICFGALFYFGIPRLYNGAPIETSTIQNMPLSQEEAIAQTYFELNVELKKNGGWGNWVAQTEGYRYDLGRLAGVARTDAENKIETGSGIWLSLGPLFAQSQRLQLVNDDPITVDRSTAVVDSIVGFEQYLAEINTDLIFVPVPVLTNVYSELISEYAPPAGVHPDPYVRSILHDLVAANVEIVDVFSLFQSAKNEPGEDILFYHNDPHLRSPAKRIVAMAIADRLMRYPSVRNGLADREAYKERIIDGPKLLEYNISRDSEDAFSPCKECGYEQILTPSGEATRLVKNASPVLIVGDSFCSTPITGVDRALMTGVGIADQLIREIKLPVALSYQLGGGPKVPKTITLINKDLIGSRDVVVWIMGDNFLRESFDKLWRDYALPE